MDEFLQSLTKGLKERLSSTFIFNFLLLWVVYNWKFVYVTLFVEEAHLKPDTKYDMFVNNDFVYWTPLGLAFVLSLLLPIVNAIILSFKYFVIRGKELFENWFDGGIAHTNKRYADLKKRFQTIESKYNIAIVSEETRIAEIEDLKASLQMYSQELNTLRPLTKINGDLKVENTKLSTSINEKLNVIKKYEDKVEYEINQRAELSFRKYIFHKLILNISDLDNEFDDIDNNLCIDSIEFTDDLSFFHYHDVLHKILTLDINENIVYILYKAYDPLNINIEAFQLNTNQVLIRNITPEYYLVTIINIKSQTILHYIATVIN